MIGMPYSLNPFEWLGLVLLLLSTGGVPQMCSIKHEENSQDHPLTKV